MDFEITQPTSLRDRYYLLDWYSKAMTVFWLPFLVVMMLLGLAIGAHAGLFFGLLISLLFGIVIAVPMIIFGQYAGAFLDQAETLMSLQEENR